MGYEDQGNGAYQALGWGRPEENLSLAVAIRRADSAKSADGSELASAFKQTSALFHKVWKGSSSGAADARTYELTIIPSIGWDIAKANTDFPRRTTSYPRERHLVINFAVEKAGRWRTQIFAHPNDLQTQTETPGESRSELVNESFDLGASFLRGYNLRGALRGRIGLEYFGRRDVSATEWLREGNEAPEMLRSLKDAQLDEIGAFATGGWSWGPVQLEGALRWSRFRQANEGARSEDDGAVNASLGVVVPLSRGFHLIASTGSGQRLPSLSERFFSGTTGRGGVFGNPDLDSERSFNMDLGIRWSGKRAHLAVFAFENRIEDYIERIEVAPDLLTFVNLTSGTLRGIELDGFHQLNTHLRLTFGGHLMEGDGDGEDRLADVPPDRFRASLQGRFSSWELGAEGQYRAPKNEPGSGEKRIPEAFLLSASVGRTFTPSLSLALTASNLLNEEYFASADRKAPMARGRSLGLHISWSGG